MPRRTFVVLCGFLAACGCTVVNRTANGGAIIDCDRDGNSTACEVKRIQEIQPGGGQTASRLPKKLDGGFLRNDDEQVTSRKKKYKGYGQLLLYFLGASKLTMLYVIVNAVAAIAGKALIVGKVALAIATAVLLKKVSEHKEKVSYEIIKHPHHTYEHTHSASFDYDHHGGFGENDFGYRRRRKLFR